MVDGAAGFRRDVDCHNMGRGRACGKPPLFGAIGWITIVAERKRHGRLIGGPLALTSNRALPVGGGESMGGG